MRHPDQDEDEPGNGGCEAGEAQEGGGEDSRQGAYLTLPSMAPSEVGKGRESSMEKWNHCHSVTAQLCIYR